MKTSFELSIDVSEPFAFKESSLDAIKKNIWVKNQWPLVYFIQDEDIKLAYVGESTNAESRIKNHLVNDEKKSLKTISLIGSDKFNKSATLDIESKLIQYITAEGTYQLLNGNYGLVNHNYYQQDLYKDLFKTIWQKLVEKKIVSKSLEEIENSELFKYSPYKSLNEDQYNSVLQILNGLNTNQSNQIIVQGSAGTGKTILATYLIKLLTTNTRNIQNEDLNENEIIELNYIRDFQAKYPNAKIGLVIAMTSLKDSLTNVFKKVPGLKGSMILTPSDTFKLAGGYDLLIVDEAHRLRQYRNIGWMGAFKKNNQKLGLDDNGDELDWIIANSRNQIFFYDSAQSVKPSDVSQFKFDRIVNNEKVIKIKLTSQMRVKGEDANDYIKFVDDLMNINLKKNFSFSPRNYDLQFFDSLKDLYSELEKKENEFGLCRLVAGYSWPWSSKENKDAIDIEIEGMEFQWNKANIDWVNSPNAFKEIGCIHTVQGYDLNYTGVIFGKEIDYNFDTNSIEINLKNYFDKNGKNGVTDINEIKNYIINIYKTVLYRGIKGTFIYACNDGLRKYLKQNLVSFKKELPFRILEFKDVKPYVNSVPLYDISVAAGNFSNLQIVNEYEELEWIELPLNISVKKEYFVCKIIGESMNKKIPNGAYCLFKKYEGGSRDGKIVLAHHHHIQDKDFGLGYTIKEYSSQKFIDENGWHHQSITLKPLSYDNSFQSLLLEDDELVSLKVIGIFVEVLHNI